MDRRIAIHLEDVCNKSSAHGPDEKGEKRLPRKGIGAQKRGGGEEEVEMMG